jgi:hypothetical protein
MKKLIILFVLIAICRTASAQEIGARFGDVLGNTVAVDAILGSGGASRLHADVSFGSSVGLELLWDVLYRKLGDGGFNWYVGLGASALFQNPFRLGASGEVGLEYHFDGIPIAIGADWRPTFWIIDNTEFHAGGFGVNARFVFK